MHPYRTFHSLLLEELRDPDYAIAYLQVALEELEVDRNLEHFQIALRHLAEAHPQVLKGLES